MQGQRIQQAYAQVERQRSIKFNLQLVYYGRSLTQIFCFFLLSSICSYIDLDETESPHYQLRWLVAIGLAFEMLLRGALLVVGVAFCVNDAISAKLPDYIQICRRSDPNVEQCILNSIEGLRPRLKDGIPELDVPPLEPLNLPQVGTTTPDSQGFMAIGKNVKAYGGSNFVVNKLKLDLSQENRPTIHLALTLPHLEIVGDYEVNARVLVLPIQGKGVIKFNATNTIADLVLYGQIYKKGNNSYLRFIRMDMLLKMDDYNIHLDNLFGGDKILGEATNQALNDNKKEFMQSLSPGVTRTVTEIALEIANNITKNHPIDEIFPK